jgi:O-antigen ligase
MHGNVPRSVDSGRLYIWREVLKLVPQHPLFGAGPDTLSLAGIEPFQRYDESLELMLYAGIDAAHSEYLNVLYHQGAFALAALLAALVSALAAWVRRARENAAAAILGSAVLCYVVQASFNISMCFTASLFWCVLGLLDGCCVKNEQKGRKQ